MIIAYHDRSRGTLRPWSSPTRSPGSCRARTGCASPTDSRPGRRSRSGRSIRAGSGIGDASAGLCGGMSWLVRERFEAGLPVPADTLPPAHGTPLFRGLVRRQVLSLDWLRTPIRFWWMGAIGQASAAERVHAVEWPRIRADIDAGRLAMVGLVRHQGASPWRLTQSHQVLAYAYEIDERRPARHDPHLRPEPAGPRRRGRHRGALPPPAVAVRPRRGLRPEPRKIRGGALVVGPRHLVFVGTGASCSRRP